MITTGSNLSLRRTGAAEATLRVRDTIPLWKASSNERCAQHAHRQRTYLFRRDPCRSRSRTSAGHGTAGQRRSPSSGGDACSSAEPASPDASGQRLRADCSSPVITIPLFIINSFYPLLNHSKQTVNPIF